MTTQAKRVLLVDDEEKLLDSIARRLNIMGFEPLKAINGMTAIKIAMDTPIDLAIVDLQMPDMNGLVTITKLKEIHPQLKTILLTGYGNEKVKQATESLNTMYFEKEAMGDFWGFIRQLNADGRVVVIHPADATGGGESPRRSRGGEVEIRSPGKFSTGASDQQYESPSEPKRRPEQPPLIVGETPAMLALRQTIQRMAPLDCAVTLCGEPGTGKERVARAIHAGSPRNVHRFLAINCENLRNEPLAVQLLGCKSADLQEALNNRSGVFRTGRVGTLFFEQVEKLPIRMQLQLIAILDGADHPHAAGRDGLGVAPRIILATESDLAQLSRDGTFNPDLYERIRIVEMTIPPLRQRKDDIPPLCRYFFDRYRRELGKPVEAISPKVVETLVDYDFPGNVRELAHIIERAIILSDGDTIECKHLPTRFASGDKLARSHPPKHFSTLAEREKRYISQVLQAHNGNKSRSAEVLGISRAALWRKLKHFKAEEKS